MYENQNQYPNQEHSQSNYGSYGSASYSNYDFGSREANQGTTYGNVAGGGIDPRDIKKPTPPPKGPSKVASYFGGGGHVRAAGCTMKGTFHDCVNNLSFHIEEQLRANERTNENV